MNLKKGISLLLSAVTVATGVFSTMPMITETEVQAAASYPVQRFRMGISDSNRNVNAEDSAVKSAVDNGTAAENWTLNYVSSGVFEIVSSANGQILTSNGTDVALANDTDGANQRWRIEGVQKDYDGYYLYYKIVSNANTSQALTFSTDDNSFYLSSYSGDSWQKYKINLTGCEGFAANCMTESGEKACTIGGLFGKIVFANSADELISYMDSKDPLTIVVNNTIDMRSYSRNRIRDNKTIVGAYGSGKLIDCELRTNDFYGTVGDEPSDNIVIQNIDFLAKNERGRILVQIWSSRQIWIDHCTFNSELSRDVDEVGKFIWLNTPYDTYMDAKDRLRSIDYITISYCQFRNRFWTVAYGTQNSEITRDRTTLMYNWWDQCVRRCPQLGNGNAHIYNNYYTGNDNGNDESTDQIIGGDGCNIISQNCRFQSLAKGDCIIGGGGNQPYRDDNSYYAEKSNSTPQAINYKCSNTSTWYPNQSNYGYSLIDAYNTKGTDTKDFCLKYSGRIKSGDLKFITDSDLAGFVSTKYECPFKKPIDVMDGKPGAVFDTSYTYMFRNAGSDLYLEVAGGKAEAGTNVQQGNSGAKNWTLQDAGNGYYKIYSEVGDGKSFLLDLDYGKVDNGTNIGIWGDTASDAQSFKFVANGDGTYAIVTKATRDKSGVGIDSGSTAEGANVIQWTLDGTDNQKWIPEIRLNTSGKLITNLRVSDMTYTSGWKFDESLAVGDLVFGDRDVTYVTLPDTLVGAEYIVTSCDAKSVTTDLATFTAGADITVYVAIDARTITNYGVPSWMSSWTNTGLTAINSKNVNFSIYSKDVSSGTTVTLGQNGGSSGCVNYAVMAVEQIAAEEEAVWGDASGDGIVDAIDGTMVTRAAVGRLTLSDSVAKWCDVNGDGYVDAIDATMIIRRAVGVLKVFPVE